MRDYEAKVFSVNIGSVSLKYPTWFPLSCWAMKTIVPFTQDNQKIFIHALIRFEETQDESDFGDSSFKVISHTFKMLAIIYPINVVMREIYTHLCSSPN